MSTPPETQKPEAANDPWAADSSTALPQPSRHSSKYWVFLSAAIFLDIAAFTVLGISWTKIFGAPEVASAETSSAPPRATMLGQMPAGARKMPEKEVVFYINKVLRNDIDTRVAKEFTSISEALAKAPPGIMLRIRDQEVYEEQIVHGRGTAHTTANLRIFAEKDADGKSATLRLPPEAPVGTPLVLLDRADGFTIRGLALDGDNRCDDTVILHGDCQGALLEDVQIKGFRRTGVRLQKLQSNVDPHERRRITLRDLRIECTNKTDDPNSSAIAMENIIEQVNIIRCRFVGPNSATLRIDGDLRSVALENNLFCGGQKSAIAVGREPGEPLALDLQLHNNTFGGYQHALLIRSRPAADSILHMNNNLFYQVTQGIGGTEGNIGADQLAGLLEGQCNVHDTRSPLGTYEKLGKVQFQALAFELSTNLGQPTKLLRYSRKSPLATAGQDGTFVGALLPLLD